MTVIDSFQSWLIHFFSQFWTLMLRTARSRHDTALSLHGKALSICLQLTFSLWWSFVSLVCLSFSSLDFRFIMNIIGNHINMASGICSLSCFLLPWAYTVTFVWRLMICSWEVILIIAICILSDRTSPSDMRFCMKLLVFITIRRITAYMRGSSASFTMPQICVKRFFTT